MELRQLRYFRAVAEAGSFSAAAAQLGVAQPSLSVAIAKLESELEVALLTRTSRGVETTAAGRHLLAAGSRLVDDANDLAASLRRFAEGVAGSLTIAAVPVLMWHRIPALLRAHAAVAPDVEVRLVDPPPWEAIDLLRRRAVDVAAVVVTDARRFAGRYRAEFDISDWGEVPLVAALPPDRRSEPDPLPLRTFTGAQVVMPRRAASVPSLPEAVDAEFRQHGITPAAIHEIDTIQASLPLVEAGLAMAILPDPDGASLRRFSVVTRALDPAPLPLRALLLTRAGETATPAIGRLIRSAATATRSAPVASEESRTISDRI